MVQEFVHPQYVSLRHRGSSTEGGPKGIGSTGDMFQPRMGNIQTLFEAYWWGGGGEPAVGLELAVSERPHMYESH